MNLLDLLLIMMAVMAAVGGYRLGFVTRFISWLGLVGGIVLALVILPGLMRRMDDGSHGTLMVLAIATLLGCALVGQGIGLALGSRLHIALPRQGPARQVDQAAGALLGLIGVLVILWLFLPSLSRYDQTAALTRESTVSRWVDGWFPTSPDPTRDIAGFVTDNFPQVFDGMTRAPDAGPPPEASGISQAVHDQVVQSVVKVHGVACRRIQEGSGWVVDQDLIVTNAHVVAGERETEVELSDGSSRDAVVVAYDPRRDLAVLRVDNLGRPALPTRHADVGDTGGVFGYPGGGPLTISPFQVSDRINATGTDIYDRHRSERRVLVLASGLAPGDSGAAIVDPQGQVIGVAFAIAPDRSNVAYALDLVELEAVMAENNLATAQDTGSCLA